MNFETPNTGLWLMLSAVLIFSIQTGFKLARKEEEWPAYTAAVAIFLYYWGALMAAPALTLNKSVLEYAFGSVLSGIIITFMATMVFWFLFHWVNIFARNYARNLPDPKSKK